MATAGDPWVGSTTLGYDAVGNLHQVSSASTAGATLATTYGYDHLNRLTSQAQASGATTLSAYQYTLGPAGNRLQAAETARTVTYAYDATYRLTSESVTLGGSVAYSYDNVGNRLTRTSTFAAIPSTTSTYDADDRLGSDSYDADGNTIGSTAAPAAGATDTYDFENRLVQRNLAGAVTTIAYDGDGNKSRRPATGSPRVTTIFLIDTNSPTGYAQIAEEMVNGAVTEAYVYGLDRIAERSASALVSYYGYDGPGQRHLHPHLLPHSIEVHLLRRGTDIRYIQAFLGHASLDCTRVYLRLVPGHLKEDYEKAMPEIVLNHA